MNRKQNYRENPTRRSSFTVVRVSRLISGSNGNPAAMLILPHELSLFITRIWKSCFLHLFCHVFRCTTCWWNICFQGSWCRIIWFVLLQIVCASWVDFFFFFCHQVSLFSHLPWFLLYQTVGFIQSKLRLCSTFNHSCDDWTVIL